MEWINKKTVKLSNQETLAYVEAGTKGPTLVLLHGNLSSSYHWMPLIHELKEFYHILAFDLRGFGDSSYVNRFDDLFALAEDVRLALNQLNVQHYFAMGWSAGGGVAMALASMDSRVQKLILMSSMSYRGLPVYQKDAQGKIMFGVTYANKDALAKDLIQVVPIIRAQETKDAAYMKWLWDLVIFTVKKPVPELDKIWIQESLKQRNLVDLDWAIMNFNIGAGKTDYAQGNMAIDRIKVPVLMLWGQQDKTVWEYMVRETAFALGKKCTLKFYNDCGHDPIVDQLSLLKNDIQTFIS